MEEPIEDFVSKFWHETHALLQIEDDSSSDEDIENNPRAMEDDSAGIFCPVYSVAMVSSLVFLSDDLLGSLKSYSPRNPPVAKQRLIWNDFVELEVKRGTFDLLHRMDYASFCILIELLGDSLQVNEEMALRRSPAETVIPDLRLHCLLRWAAGGSYLDIVSKVNIHGSTFYYIIWDTCQAICESICAHGFWSISTASCVCGCVGAIDGWLLRTACPSKKFTNNPTSFFSGHYLHYGLNVQAVCNHECKFSFISVATPGSQPDINAVERCGVLDLIQQLPFGYYIIGDNAYPPPRSFSQYLEGQTVSTGITTIATTFCRSVVSGLRWLLG